MDYSLNDCIDAGTENCPCYLALTGDCLTCTRLRGNDNCDCDCNWRGVCIYNEFILGNKKVNNPRKDFESPIIGKKYYMEDLAVFVLGVEEGFALKLMRPGSYIFLRSKEDPSFFDTPISVMKADPSAGQIHVAIKLLSAKTKALAESADSLIIRGVYRNGIQGLRHLIDNKNRGRKILFITKGICMAPAPMAAEMLRYGNHVDFIIDKEKICDEFITDYLNIREGVIRYLSLANETDLNYLMDLLTREEYENVVILTSDYYRGLLTPLIKQTLPSAKLSWGNNIRICCGEGVCGSCTITDNDGRTIKLCKCQLLSPSI